MAKKRTKSEARTAYAVCLGIGLAMWGIGAALVSLYLSRQDALTALPCCMVSCLYLVILLGVMAIGNFARVRTLLTLEMLYGIGVVVRSVLGVADSLFLLDMDGHNWVMWLDKLTLPLGGLRYAATQLTAHFETELYWFITAICAAILLFLAYASRLAVRSRIARVRAYQREQREQTVQQMTGAGRR